MRRLLCAVGCSCGAAWSLWTIHAFNVGVLVEPIKVVYYVEIMSCVLGAVAGEAAAVVFVLGWLRERGLLPNNALKTSFLGETEARKQGIENDSIYIP